MRPSSSTSTVVLLDSEQVWDVARREVTMRHEGHWTAAATAAMQGMSSAEWARYMRGKLGVQLELDEIIDEVLSRLFVHYERRLSLLPGAVSSEEVAHGKPSPDVYLEAARRLVLAPSDCAAIEDSENGIRSAAAAQMKIVAISNREFPPGQDALAEADWSCTASTN